MHVDETIALIPWKCNTSADIQGEIGGKASNVRWAFHNLEDYINKLDIPEHTVLVHVCDSDSLYHRRYFSCMNYTYLTTPEKERASIIWQSPMVH